MTQTIKFDKTAYAKMMLHATVNSTTAIHGILVGSSNSKGQEQQQQGNDVLIVHDAIPICHSIPTKPIVDMGLRLTQAHLDRNKIIDNNSSSHDKIIGWYTANERTGDTKIYPMVWKILESIQSFHTDQEKTKTFVPIVARIDSESFEKMLEKKCNVDGDFKGFHVFELPKTLAQDNNVEEEEEEEKVKCECLPEGAAGASDNWKNVSALVADACLEDPPVVVYDFEDQLEGKVSGLNKMDSDWLRNLQVNKIWEK